MPIAVEQAIASLGPQLESFSLFGGAWKPVGTEWLASLPNLRTLQLQHHYLSPRLSLPTFQLSKFTGFHTSDSVTEGRDFIEDLLDTSRPTLTSLMLLDSSGTPTLDLSAFTAVRELTLRGSFGPDHDLRAEGIKLAKLMRRTPPRLVALSLATFASSPLRSIADDSVLDLTTMDFLRVVTPNLQSLRAPYDSFTFTYLYNTLADSRYLPSLRTLELEVDPEDLADTLGSREALELEIELLKLKAIAERRGIQLSW